MRPSIIIIESLTRYETFAMKTNCWKEVERTLNSKEVLNVLISLLCAYDKSDIFEKKIKGCIKGQCKMSVNNFFEIFLTIKNFFFQFYLIFFNFISDV